MGFSFLRGQSIIVTAEDVENRCGTGRDGGCALERTLRRTRSERQRRASEAGHVGPDRPGMA